MKKAHAERRGLFTERNRIHYERERERERERESRNGNTG
jgi:hypothetical protein